jgi:hypothetical protein
MPGASHGTLPLLKHALGHSCKGTGPDSSTAAAVADYNLAHRSTLLASEVAVGLALLAFIPFLAALVGVADSNQPAAVLALDQLQGRTPIVWTITALVTVLSLVIHRTGLVWRWLGAVGLVAAAIFLWARSSAS